MFQIKAKLLYNKRVKDNYLRCALVAPLIAKKVYPGQFVNIKVTDTFNPLLRRPFSVFGTNGTNIEILYEIVGKGTEILSQKKAGEYLDIIGPLGNGFDYGTTGTTDDGRRTTVLVAGGMGVAPLVFLPKKLMKFKIQNSKFKILVLIGAKTKRQILCEKEFKSLGCDVKIATDDGSRGFKGKVTELLRKILATGYRLQATGLKLEACSMQPEVAIYACGPKPMLKEISRISQKYNIPAQISLEEHMACGIGACFGCSVNTKQGFKRVCKEGPVFEADEIIW